MRPHWHALLAASIFSMVFTAAYFAVIWWLEDPQYRMPWWLLGM